MEEKYADKLSPQMQRVRACGTHWHSITITAADGQGSYSDAYPDEESVWEAVYAKRMTIDAGQLVHTWVEELPDDDCPLVMAHGGSHTLGDAGAVFFQRITKAREPDSTGMAIHVPAVSGA